MITSKVSIEENGQEGEVFVSFTATQTGEFQVSVTFRRKNLQGSPFGLEMVDRPVYHRDYTKIDDQPASRFRSNQFFNPFSVAGNSRGEIIVTDTHHHHIQVYDRNGIFMFRIGWCGQENGQFFYPQGVTVDPRNSQIVVADTVSHRIQTFEKGTFLRVFGSKGKGDEQFCNPRGVVVDQQGNYVCRG